MKALIDGGIAPLILNLSTG